MGRFWGCYAQCAYECCATGARPFRSTCTPATSARHTPSANLRLQATARLPVSWTFTWCFGGTIIVGLAPTPRRFVMAIRIRQSAWACGQLRVQYSSSLRTNNHIVSQTALMLIGSLISTKMGVHFYLAEMGGRWLTLQSCIFTAGRNFGHRAISHTATQRVYVPRKENR